MPVWMIFAPWLFKSFRLSPPLSVSPHDDPLGGDGVTRKSSRRHSLEESLSGVVMEWNAESMLHALATLSVNDLEIVKERMQCHREVSILVFYANPTNDARGSLQVEKEIIETLQLGNYISTPGAQGEAINAPRERWHHTERRRKKSFDITRATSPSLSHPSPSPRPSPSPNFLKPHDKIALTIPCRKTLSAKS